jgi:hypothetical protein
MFSAPNARSALPKDFVRFCQVRAPRLPDRKREKRLENAKARKL